MDLQSKQSVICFGGIYSVLLTSNDFFSTAYRIFERLYIFILMICRFIAINIRNTEFILVLFISYNSFHIIIFEEIEQIKMLNDNRFGEVWNVVAFYDGNVYVLHLVATTGAWTPYPMR